MYVKLVDKITKAGHFYAKFKCIFFLRIQKVILENQNI